MKVCQKCGHVNYRPEDKCPVCGDKYTGYSCDPLSASTKDTVGNESCNGYITTGDNNARHNKD